MVPEILPVGQAVPIAVGTPDTGCVCRLVGASVGDDGITMRWEVLLPLRPQADVPLVEPLTRRELGVLDLIAQGRTVRQVAAELGLSDRTVRSHLTHVMDKLGVHNRPQVVLAAVTRGLITH